MEEPMEMIRVAGFAIAAAARDRGADVTVVCGITQVEPPTGVRVIRVESTQELYDAVTVEAKLADVVIQAAAPADYRFAVRHDQKLKKQDGMPFMVELVENPDIAAAVGSASQSSRSSTQKPTFFINLPRLLDR